MATTLASTSAPTMSSTNRDRIFYSAMAIALALTVLIGFSQTYFLKVFRSAPMATLSGASFTPLVHLHGLLFTSWVLLFIVQTALVAGHKVAVHRKLGIAGGVLALAMVIVGVSTSISAAARGSAPPGVDPRSFMIIPLGDMVLFGGFVIAALSLRRNKEAHKRLMLLAYISIVVAAVARVPGVLPLGPLGFFGFTFIFLLAAIAYDLITRRRVHPAYIWGGSIFVASVPLRLAISGTETWKAIAGAIIR
ncbi:MAG TPA: hypothetical protein VM056_06390 [Terriglobales bacterium]|nr:hypothetical protein [Terriglobales bacterium]